MDPKQEARLIYQVLEQQGNIEDPRAVINHLEQLQRGLPVEDEFAAMCEWSGRCRAVVAG